jgi:hypothetical protein
LEQQDSRWPELHWRDFCSLPALRACAPMIVRSAFPGPIIVFMKLLNIMDAKAARLITLAINFTKPVRTAIRAITAGGMKTVTVGALTAIGMITTMIDMIANIRPNNSHSLEKWLEAQCYKPCASFFRTRSSAHPLSKGFSNDCSVVFNTVCFCTAIADRDIYSAFGFCM